MRARVGAVDVRMPRVAGYGGGETSRIGLFFPFMVAFFNVVTGAQLQIRSFATTFLSFDIRYPSHVYAADSRLSCLISVSTYALYSWISSGSSYTRDFQESR